MFDSVKRRVSAVEPAIRWIGFVQFAESSSSLSDSLCGVESCAWFLWVDLLFDEVCVAEFAESVSGGSLWKQCSLADYL